MTGAALKNEGEALFQKNIKRIFKPSTAQIDSKRTDINRVPSKRKSR